MLKLYKLNENKKEYWETWGNDDGSHVIHYGELGTKGDSKVLKPSLLKNPSKIIQKKINKLVEDGFQQIDDVFTLMVEYKVDGFGTPEDLEKRSRLQDQMNEILGWTGLGNCDGGSIGSDTMEVCNYVVDFDIAKKVIEEKLKDTEFKDYTRIYNENV